MLTLFTISLSLLVAVWLLYPAVMRLLAGLAKPRRARPNDELPHVSLVIATREPPPDVRARVDDLLAAEYPADRLHVIVGLDANRVEQTVEQYGHPDPRVRVIVAKAPGKAAALNSAVALATTDLLVFSDTAQRFESGTIRALVEALASPRTGAVSGCLETAVTGAPSVRDVYWSMERRLREDEARVHSSVGVTGAVYAMRRTLWVDLPDGLILDDLYVPMQLVTRGYRIDFRRDAVARDGRRFAESQEHRRKVRTLTGVLQLCVWMPAVLVPWRNPVWAQFVFHKLLRFGTPFLMLVAGVSGLVLATRQARRVLGIDQADPVVVAAAALLLLVIGAIPGARRALIAVFSMQGAVLRALVKAARGDWDVWRA